MKNPSSQHFPPPSGSNNPGQQPAGPGGHGPGYSYAYGESSNLSARLDVGQWLQVIFGRIWVIIGLTVAIGVSGAIYALKQPNVYHATAVVQVAAEEQKVVNIEDVSHNMEDLHTLEALNTIAHRLRQTSVLLRVVRTNDLTGHPAFMQNGKRPSEESVIRALLGGLQTKIRQNTRLIEIGFEDTNADVVALVANSVGTNFIRENIEEKLGVNKTANEVLIEEAEKLKERLKASEQALHEYKAKHNAVALQDTAVLPLETLTRMKEEYGAAKADRDQIQSDMQALAKVGDDPRVILNLPTVSKDLTIQSLRKSVIDQETTVATMTNRYKPKYPKMIQAQRTLVDMRQSLNQTVLSFRDIIKASYDAAEAREKAVGAQVKQAENEALEMDRLKTEFNVLSRQLESEKVLYEQVLKRIKETDLAKGLENNAVTFVEHAFKPLTPFKPDRKRIAFLSCIGGFAVSLALVFFLNFIDSSVRTVDEAEGLLGIPVIGAIPLDKAAHRSHQRKVVIDDANSTCAEAYRSFVAALDMMGRMEENSVVLFTSALPSEGKTFSSVNYAITHAQKDRRTLIIDFDLRRPSIADSFGLDDKHPGVTDYLLGKSTLDSLVVPVPGVPSLYLLPAGPRVPNPAEQIAKPWVAQLLAEAKSKFDRVILDTPPMNAVSDTSYLLPFAAVVCLVIRSGKTPLKAVQRTVKVMERNGAKPSGLVLNYLPERSGYGYYYYYYHYYARDGYSSKGVYGAGEDKRRSRRSSSKKSEKQTEQTPS